MQHVLNASEYETVFYVVLIQSGFYIAYLFNCVFDGTIYGRGKTQYMLIESIALMFGIGTALDLIPTIACYIYLLKKEGVKPAFRLIDERKGGE